MQYLNPGYLWGLLAAATPIIIYILLRRRRQEIPWGASYLLRLTLASRRKSSLWKQYLVLAMRCAVLALLAVLISEPFKTTASDSNVPALPAGPVHRAILVDHSASMSVTDSTGSRKGRARDALRALFGSQRHADRVTVISIIDPQRTVSISGRLSNENIHKSLERFVPVEGALQLKRSLSKAVSVLTETRDAALEVYILSDFPSEMTSQIEQIEWFPTTAKQMGIRTTAVNLVGSEGVPANIGLMHLSLGSDLVVSGIPVTLYATVSNFSDAESVARLEVTGKGLRPVATMIDLQPNEEKEVTLDVTFTSAGVQTLEASVSPSRLPTSSMGALSIEVNNELNIWLLVDQPDPTDKDALDEAEFLRRAASSNSPLKVTEIELVRLAQEIPPEVDVILLAGPRVITPTVTEPITRFVRRGGGLVVFMAPRADTSFYNPNLGNLLPAKLLEPARESTTPETFWSAKAKPSAFTLLSEFATDRNGQIEAARFYNYVDTSPDEKAQVMFELEDGRPLLITKSEGRGHVYLFTSSMGISWSSLPVRRTYIPFLHRVLNMAARGRGFGRNLPPDSNFIYRWPTAGSVRMTTPNQTQRQLDTVRGSGGAFIMTTGLTERGLYELETDDVKETFTVTGKPPEADLRSLQADDLEQLSKRLGSPIYATWQEAVQAVGASKESDRLWPWLLAAMLAIYVIEAWFVRQL